MALSYTESAALMQDIPFRGRIKVACVIYADSITIAAVSYSVQSSRVRWAQRTIQMPDQVAAEVTPYVVMDGAVQTDGAAITDDALQGAVEAVVNKNL